MDIGAGSSLGHGQAQAQGSRDDLLLRYTSRIRLYCQSVRQRRIILLVDLVAKLRVINEVGRTRVDGETAAC